MALGSNIKTDIRNNIVLALAGLIIIVVLHLIQHHAFAAIHDKLIFYALDVLTGVGFLYCAVRGIIEAPKGGADNIVNILCWVFAIGNIINILAYTVHA